LLYNCNISKSDGFRREKEGGFAKKIREKTNKKQKKRSRIEGSKGDKKSKKASPATCFFWGE